MEVVKSVLCLLIAFVTLYCIVALKPYLRESKAFLIKEFEDRRFLVWMLENHWNITRVIIILIIILLAAIASITVVMSRYYLIQLLKNAIIN